MRLDRGRWLSIPQFMSSNMRCSNRQPMVTAIEAITMREPVEH
jgi:CoA:oxalate CoA-transferase